MLVALILLPVVGSGEVVLYLVPRVAAGARGLTLGDIARIEGDQGETGRLAECPIEPALYADGIVDRTEVKSLVKRLISGTSVIYGGGVRVDEVDDGGRHTDAREPLVVKGRAVRFVVTRKGVRAEVPGTALQDGVEGDTVSVKVLRSKIAHGRVTGEGMVEMGI